MSSLDPADQVQKYASATAEILAVVKESPDARAAGGELAKALHTVAKFANNLLLPLAAANWGVEKFRNYMSTKFQPELAKHVSAIPEEHLIAPRAVVAGPIMDALVYAHEDDELRQLYLSLLARAMDGRSPEVAHPAFVEVLKQIDTTEVGFLRAVIAGDDPSWPIVELVQPGASEGTHNLVVTDLMDWLVEGVPTATPQARAYLRNWSRLGLVEINYLSALARPGAYSWIVRRPEYLLTEVTGGLSVSKGIVRRTAWGEAFVDAVGINDVSRSGPVAEIGDWTTMDDGPEMSEVRWTMGF
ncbi:MULTISPECIES: DUF4393 domain-containing protein [unclassified Microbacterium]|uniref:DUF4393 domain-containing protein n=1 Tax=unclassified Microbacterium TaxID=2609290 RepID=UPI0034659126